MPLRGPEVETGPQFFVNLLLQLFTACENCQREQGNVFEDFSLQFVGQILKTMISSDCEQAQIGH